LKARKDYHAVPGILGSRKALASVLHGHWSRWHGGGELIYTRTVEGRRALLRARGRAFSSAFAKKAERFDRWQ
jgi:hypothetical protein